MVPIHVARECGERRDRKRDSEKEKRKRKRKRIVKRIVLVRYKEEYGAPIRRARWVCIPERIWRRNWTRRASNV